MSSADKQMEMLDELLSESNAEMWEAFLTQTN